SCQTRRADPRPPARLGHVEATRPAPGSCRGGATRPSATSPRRPAPLRHPPRAAPSGRPRRPEEAVAARGPPPGVGFRGPGNAHEEQPVTGNWRTRVHHRPHHRGGGALLPHEDRTSERLRQPLPVAARPAFEGPAGGGAPP